MKTYPEDEITDELLQKINRQIDDFFKNNPPDKSVSNRGYDEDKHRERNQVSNS